MRLSKAVSLPMTSRGRWLWVIADSGYIHGRAFLNGCLDLARGVITQAATTALHKYTHPAASHWRPSAYALRHAEHNWCARCFNKTGLFLNIAQCAGCRQETTVYFLSRFTRFSVSTVLFSKHLSFPSSALVSFPVRGTFFTVPWTSLQKLKPIFQALFWVL